ncbi:MAG: DMT family transporter [Muribaculaceae bacterium]
MNSKLKGCIYGVVSAASYGLNPLGGLKLGEDGINTHSILFYRFTLAVLLLAGIIALRTLRSKPTENTAKRLQEAFFINGAPSGMHGLQRMLHSRWALVAVLGVLFAISALSLYSSYLFMDSGIASTLLFVYPIMVALIMSLCFKERINFFTVASLVLALSGIALLSKGGSASTINLAGFTLVMISSLAYAVYMVVLNKWQVSIPTLKLNMYVMALSAVCIAATSFTRSDWHLMALPSWHSVAYALMLAIVPTVISLVTMTKAIELIGSTPTAIMGALEPVTAVVVGIIVFNEAFTARIALGNLLIITAVMLIISSRYLLPACRKRVSPDSHAKQG